MLLALMQWQHAMHEQQSGCLLFRDFPYSLGKNDDYLAGVLPQKWKHLFSRIDEQCF
jgi:hypothetical protein